VEKIRVLFANKPRLMRELLMATICDQPDIEIAGEIQDNDTEVMDAVEKTHPDFLIVALEKSEERPAICDFVLQKHPQIKIIAIAPERDSTIYYWAALDIRSNRIETSEESLLNALRGKLQDLGRLPCAS
jgi:DNA-binding NarL/FixJ family response regulator